MIKYLIDASAAIEFYRPKWLHTICAFRRTLELRQFIRNQRENKKAIPFIPSFCISEVRNILAKWFYREHRITQERFEKIFHKFLSDVHNRRFFYSYDLNRYHNLNTDEVLNIEHTTETEFQATGLPPGTDAAKINEELRKKNPYDYASKHHLSSFDILIIAMGIELKKIYGEEIYLLTGDKRLNLISSKKSDIFPHPFYWPKLQMSKLEEIEKKSLARIGMADGQV